MRTIFIPLDCTCPNRNRDSNLNYVRNKNQKELPKGKIPSSRRHIEGTRQYLAESHERRSREGLKNMGLVQQKGYCILESKQLPAAHGIDLLPIPLNAEALSAREMIREFLVSFPPKGKRKMKIGNGERLMAKSWCSFLFSFFSHSTTSSWPLSQAPVFTACHLQPSLYPPLLLYHLLYPQPQTTGIYSAFL